MQYPQQPMNNPYQPPQQPMQGNQMPPPMPMQPMPPMQGEMMPPMGQPLPMQNVQMPPVQPMPMQPMPVQEPMPQVPLEQPAPEGEASVPLSSGFKRVAGLYTKDTWLMLLGLTGILAVIFVIIRLATRGYMWGLVFVLAAGLALEIPALMKFIQSLGDKASGQMQVRTAHLQSVAAEQPSLLARLGLSSRTRYSLMDDQGRRYYFVADKGLDAAFGDLAGAEAEIAYLASSGLMTGLHPVRRGESQSVFESARERHLRQVFRDYLP